MKELDFDLLEKVYRYGGYATMESAMLIRRDKTYSQVWQTLNKLENKGYLIKGHLAKGSFITTEDFSINYEASAGEGSLVGNFPEWSRREKVVYKVTPKTCNYLNYPNSCQKRDQPLPVVEQSLLRQYFFSEIDYKGLNVVGDYNDKKRFLSDIGFRQEMMPKKFEEWIIDARSTKDSFICKANGEESRLDSQLFIVLIDDFCSNPTILLKTCRARYGDIWEAGIIPVSFIVAVDNKEREEGYRKSMKILRSPGYGKEGYAYKISLRLIEQHLEAVTLIKGQLDIEYSAKMQFEDDIRDKYRRLDFSRYEAQGGETGTLAAAINERGIDEVLARSKTIVNSFASREQKLERINTLYDNIYYLASIGKIFNRTGKKMGANLDFDVKIYRTSKCFG